MSVGFGRSVARRGRAVRSVRAVSRRYRSASAVGFGSARFRLGDRPRAIRRLRLALLSLVWGALTFPFPFSPGGPMGHPMGPPAAHGSQGPSHGSSREPMVPKDHPGTPWRPPWDPHGHQGDLLLPLETCTKCNITSINNRRILSHLQKKNKIL